MPVEQEVKAWYNRRYASHGLASMRPRRAYADFLDRLNPAANWRLLDVSCGVGYLLAEARDRGLSSFGMDLSVEAAHLAKQAAPGFPVALCRGEQLCFRSGAFHYLTCIGSLEHFLSMDAGLEEMKRVTSPEARFCIVVPNSDYFIWKLRGKPGTEQQDINETLLPLEAWQDLFRRHGLRILGVHQDRWFSRSVRPFSSLNPLKIIARLGYKLLWLFLPLRWTYQFIFILTKDQNPA